MRSCPTSVDVKSFTLSGVWGPVESPPHAHRTQKRKGTTANLPFDPHDPTEEGILGLMSVPSLLLKGGVAIMEIEKSSDPIGKQGKNPLPTSENYHTHSEKDPPAYRVPETGEDVGPCSRRFFSRIPLLRRGGCPRPKGHLSPCISGQRCNGSIQLK